MKFPVSQVALLVAFTATFSASAQTVLYMRNASSGPSGTGPDTASKTIFFDDASTNTPYTTPTSVTFTYTNQVFSSLEGIPNANGLQFGASASGIGNYVNAAIPSYSANYPNLVVGAPVDAQFTTEGAQALSVGSNRAQVFTTMPDALIDGSGNTAFPINGKHKYGEVTFYFNRPVSNPILHLNGLGGANYFWINAGADGIPNNTDDTIRYLGWSTELRLKSYTGAGASMSLLSGNGVLAVSGNDITNSATAIGPSTQGGGVLQFGVNRYAAGGSVKVTGSNITSITFEVFLRGDGGTYQLRNGTQTAATAPAPQWSNQAGSVYPAYNPSLDQEIVAADVYQVGVSLLKPVTVSGNVFNDPDQGNVNNSSGMANSVPSGLYAFLVDNNGNIVDKAPVNTDGTYLFSEVYAGNYKVQISTNSTLTRGLGAPPATPGASVTSGYSFTGTFNGAPNTGNSGAMGTSTSFSVTPNANTADINFGIRQSTPFGCGDAQAFISKGPNTNVQIYLVNPNTGVSSVVANLPGLANALAYNPTNSLLNFLYAPYSGGALPQPNLYQVDAAGAVTQLAVPNLSSVPFSNPTAGTITPNGYYIANVTSGPANTGYVVIDVNPSRSTYLQIVDPAAGYAIAAAPYYKTAGAPLNLSDFAANTNGLLYGIINSGTDAGKIQIFDPVTGNITTGVQAQLTNGTNLGANVYGSAFFDGTGRLYTQVNANGIFYTTNITTGVTVQLATTGNATNTDGGACPTSTISNLIMGNVFNDANGQLGTPANTVDGTPTNIAGALHAILYDVTTGLVAAVTDVAANGTYSFGATPGHNYSVYVTTNTVAVGSSVPPAIALPAGWVNTGEHVGANAGSDGTVNGILPVGNVTGDVTNANFGIERTPESDDKTTTIASPTPNSFATLDGNIGNPPFFTGSDPEDQATSGTLSTKTVAITSLPTNGQLFYNGVQIAVGGDGINPPSATNPFIIRSFDPSLMQVKFTGTGYSSLSFTYAYVDAADKQDPTPATYTLNWNIALPLQLISFSGRNSEKGILLDWKTAMETGMDRFDVQYGTDGIHFINIGKVAARNAVSGSDYTFPYMPATSGKGYYRLSIADKKGSVTLSNTITLTTGAATFNVTILPNPTNDILNINGLTAGDKIQIFSNAGKLMVSLTAGDAMQQISIGAFANGTYQVVISNNGLVIKNLAILKQ